MDFAEEDIGTAEGALTVADLAYAEVKIQSRWRCAEGDSRCDMHLSFTGEQVELYPKNNTADLVPWRITVMPQRSGKVADLFTSKGSIKPAGTYGRGVGTIPDRCSGGKVMDSGLCYPKCDDGYEGEGPVCWEECPSGYTDIGALCQYTDGSFTKGCSWHWTWSLGVLSYDQEAELEELRAAGQFAEPAPPAD